MKTPGRGPWSFCEIPETIRIVVEKLRRFVSELLRRNIYTIK